MAVEAVIVVVGVALLASTAQSLTAFGFALISAPCLVLVLDVKDAVVVVSMLALANEVLLAVRVWSDVRWSTVATLWAGSVLGMPLGLLVLVRVPEEALRLMVGVAAVVLASTVAFGLKLSRRGVRTEVAVGVAAGVLQTSTSMSGPPVVAYLVGRGHGPGAFRGVLTMYFLVGSVTAVGIFFLSGVVTGTALALAAVALPAVCAGNVIGHGLFTRIDARLFRRVVIALLMATALSAVGLSIQRLLA